MKIEVAFFFASVWVSIKLLWYPANLQLYFKGEGSLTMLILTIVTMSFQINLNKLQMKCYTLISDQTIFMYRVDRRYQYLGNTSSYIWGRYFCSGQVWVMVELNFESRLC